MKYLHTNNKSPSKRARSGSQVDYISSVSLGMTNYPIMGVVRVT